MDLLFEEVQESSRYSAAIKELEQFSAGVDIFLFRVVDKVHFRIVLSENVSKKHFSSRIGLFHKGDNFADVAEQTVEFYDIRSHIF